MKELAGNPGHRPLPPDEPRPKPRIPECPKDLDGDARDEWIRITPLLLKMGVITLVDRAALTAYCVMWARWRDAERILKAEGRTLKSPTGYPVQHPELAIANAALENMRKFIVEFGMTPSSRTKVHAESVDKNKALRPQDDREDEDFFDQAPEAKRPLLV